ncbi:MAG: class A beta-lactamase, subclass A2 [Thermoflexibacter sp.]|nr:class A beta-lactamase, subclass A2 [Thermoflexibacter sp.]
MNHKFVLLFLFQFIFLVAIAQKEQLRQDIQTVISGKKADVGVAVLSLADRDTFSINGKKHYPMQSVYKFHLALAVLAQVDKGKLKLEEPILVKKTDLLPNTWSPLREKYPDGEVKLPLSEILTYTVSQSDNNGCDILFRLLGGTKKVHQYIKKLGIKDIAIAATEEEMHQAWDVQFTNWTTPLEAVYLLDKFFSNHILSKTSYDFLWKIMVETSTGMKRIKGLLPETAVVAHKTGTSGTNKEGISSATNDLGIIRLPNGKHIALMVFVCNSAENNETNERIIAEVGKLVYEYYSRK